jgi:RNA polymerase sigma-70 factor (ECF subfamily)
LASRPQPPEHTDVEPKEGDVPGEGASRQIPRDVGEVYRAHAQRVAAWAARLGGPSVDAEDVVQEVFLIVHRLLPTFRGDAQVTTWLFRITQNVVRHRRRQGRWRRWLGGSADDVAGNVASGRPTPVEDLERRQASDLVYRVLDGMSDRYRTVIVLFELEQRSGEEIAELLGTKVATVWVWLHRARAQFAKRLAKIDPGATAAPEGDE